MNDDKSSEKDALGQMPALSVDGGHVERRRRMVRKRWGATIAYLVMSMVLSVLPIFIEWNELYWGILITVAVVGGAAVLIAVLLVPAISGPREPDIPDGLLAGPRAGNASGQARPYNDTLKMTGILYMMLGMAIMFMVIGIWSMDMMILAIMAATSALMLVLVMIFGTLEVVCDDQVLSFHFGPFGKDVPVGEISSIRPTAIHPLKDFMGWGVRVGTGGEIGYIVSGDVGVRISIEGGKTYVVTVNDPQALVDCVRAGRGR
jgi:hypothetical protein